MTEPSRQCFQIWRFGGFVAETCLLIASGVPCLRVSMGFFIGEGVSFRGGAPLLSPCERGDRGGEGEVPLRALTPR